MDPKAEIRAYIEETFLFGQGHLSDDTSLIEERIVDSTGIIELIAFVERTFRVTVGDDEMIPENFDSVQSISAYLKKKTGG